MLYLYSISIVLSYISLILLLIRVLVNKNHIDSRSSNWKLFTSLMIIGIIPILNIIFAISSAYASILMKNENFIKLINE